MDWQTPEDAVPSAFVTESNRRAHLGRAAGVRCLARRATIRATGSSSPIGDLALESGATLPGVTIAYESWGELNADASNADPGAARPHRRQPRHRPGEARASDRRLVVGPRRRRQAARPRRLVRRRPEHARRLPGLDRPGIARPRTARSGVPASRTSASGTRSTRSAPSPTRSASTRWAAVLGGSMGGMQALEWAVGSPERVERVAVLAAPPLSSADQIALNSVQSEAIRIGSGVRRRRLLRRRRRRRPAPRPRPRPPHGAAQLPLADRAQRPLRAQLAVAASARSAAAACSRSRATSASTATSSPAASTPTATWCWWMR